MISCTFVLYHFLASPYILIYIIMDMNNLERTDYESLIIIHHAAVCYKY